MIMKSMYYLNHSTLYFKKKKKTRIGENKKKFIVEVERFKKEYLADI